MFSEIKSIKICPGNVLKPYFAWLTWPPEHPLRSFPRRQMDRPRWRSRCVRARGRWRQTTRCWVSSPWWGFPPPHVASRRSRSPSTSTPMASFTSRPKIRAPGESSRVSGPPRARITSQNSNRDRTKSVPILIMIIGYHSQGLLLCCCLVLVQYHIGT